MVSWQLACRRLHVEEEDEEQSCPGLVQLVETKADVLVSEAGGKS